MDNENNNNDIKSTNKHGRGLGYIIFVTIATALLVFSILAEMHQLRHAVGAILVGFYFREELIKYRATGQRTHLVMSIICAVAAVGFVFLAIVNMI